MNPTTGAVYALASWPSYDPSIWVAPYKGQNQVLRAAKAAKNAPISHPSPLIDRTSGEYPAGSTFKPFTAGAAWMAGLIGPGSERTCPGVYYSPYDHGKPQHCLPQLDAALDRRHGPAGGADHLLRLVLPASWRASSTASTWRTHVPARRCSFRRALRKFGYGSRRRCSTC